MFVDKISGLTHAFFKKLNWLLHEIHSLKYLKFEMIHHLFIVLFIFKKFEEKNYSIIFYLIKHLLLLLDIMLKVHL